jgi:hypothetical protein
MPPPIGVEVLRWQTMRGSILPIRSSKTTSPRLPVRELLSIFLVGAAAAEGVIVESMAGELLTFRV